MFLKMYTGLSAPKLLDLLNDNAHYQIFCDIYINPMCLLTNYKLTDGIASELAGKLNILQQQDILAEAWKAYMKDPYTFYTDATCYESEMRNPTNQKLLWECCENAMADKEFTGEEKEVIFDICQIEDVTNVELMDSIRDPKSGMKAFHTLLSF